MTRRHIAAVVLLAAASWASILAGQSPQHPVDTPPEGNTPGCTPTSTNTCSPNANLQPSAPATQRFPFPGESAPASLPTAPQGEQSPTPSPASGTDAPTGQNAARRFPFPGEATPDDSSGAASGNSAGGATQSPLKDAGSSGESSSSSSSSSSSKTNDPGDSASQSGPDLPDDDPNAPMPTPRGTLRRKLVKPEIVKSAEDMEAEDVQVAGFYANDGNYQASYKRAKDAVGLDDSDAEAHLLLADSARKLGKLDEAQVNYKKVLALDPVPKTRKAAEKALKEMSGS